MKKSILFTLLFCVSIITNAQDLISKIPATADIVASIRGKNITKLVGVKEFEKSKIGELFLKELKRETDGKVTNLEELGLNLEQNFYYFLDADEGVLSNVFLAPLNTKEGFENLLSKWEREKIVNKNGISYFVDEYDNMVTMWNNKTLVVVLTVDTEKNDYNYYDDYGYESLPTPPSNDIIIQEIEITEAAEELAEAAEEVVEVEEIEIEETVIEEVEIEETVIESTETNSYYDSEEYKQKERERKKRRELREIARADKRKALNQRGVDKAMAILTGNISGANITSNAKYMRSAGKGQDEAHIWVGDLGSIYQSLVPASYVLGSNPFELYDLQRVYGGLSGSARLNFEDDKAILKSNYIMNSEMSAIYAPMYNGTMNKNFFKYFNEDQMLGYFGINVSTEGTLQAYPKLIDYMFENNPKEEVALIVPLATELFSILVDEKGVAELLRGDMLLVLTDIKEREVTYTSYEYDDDYNRKEVTKTKTESAPDFLLMATAAHQELYSRLMRLAVKEGEANYDNGIYSLKLDRSIPFTTFIMFKDDIAFIGSSRTHLMAIQQGAYTGKVSSAHKKAISKNASSLYVNGKRIVQQIPTELYPREIQEKIGFISQNTEDVLFTTSKIKGNTMQGEMIWNTPKEGHKNSLAYILNMLAALVN